MASAKIKAIAFIFGLTLAGPAAGNSASSDDVAMKLSEARSIAEMDEAIGGFVRKEIDRVNGLSDLLRDGQTPERKARACRVLGFIRSSRAAQVLIEKVLLEIEPSAPTEAGYQPQRYPCQEALVKIGKSIEIKLVQALAATREPTTRRALLNVLCEIDGPGDAVALLERALENAVGDGRRNLEAALGESPK